MFIKKLGEINKDSYTHLKKNFKGDYQARNVLALGNITEATFSNIGV